MILLLYHGFSDATRVIRLWKEFKKSLIRLMEKKYDSAAQFEIVRAHGLTAPHNDLSAGNVLFILTRRGFLLCLHIYSYYHLLTATLPYLLEPNIKCVKVSL